ncbi:hypothetical protein HWC80_gp048 [Mycobacterium phage Indlulamithi]|uniref:Uncharacterized protein n=1 Tax=Mycobacterium phage Indlulamithi TaxID=2656582 RepID=A0A649VCM6_9CAUD|nr:hypothetical protein HWC80_gp048 [Mycobacterium phage Indlulamithi]QGJ90088.1 hypothetical protein PBI_INDLULAMITHI_48 [Mycobacterium phage Indlulamithi]
MTTTTLEDRAAELGKDYGKAVGSWVVDGNTSKEQCDKLIEGIDTCDPEVMDLIPSPLSGEFADGPTVYSVLKELGLDPAVFDEQFDHLIDVYEEAFSESWCDTVYQAAHANHPDYDPCSVCGLYGHKWKEHVD